jgi:hypothetical protein
VVAAAVSGGVFFAMQNVQHSHWTFLNTFFARNSNTRSGASMNIVAMGVSNGE